MLCFSSLLLYDALYRTVYNGLFMSEVPAAFGSFLLIKQCIIYFYSTVLWNICIYFLHFFSLHPITSKSDEVAPLQWSRFSSCLFIVITGNGLRSLSHNLERADICTVFLHIHVYTAKDIFKIIPIDSYRRCRNNLLLSKWQGGGGVGIQKKLTLKSVDINVVEWPTVKSETWLFCIPSLHQYLTGIQFIGGG
jgi:hypothetical protein